MKSPLVTIVTPAYNAEKWIYDALTSVSNQSTDHEHIIIDDGSTDGTAALVKSFSVIDPRVILVQQRNYGEATAVNLGFQKARGKYLLVLNADDRLAAGSISKLSNYLAENSAIVAVYPDWRIIDEHGVKVRSIKSAEFSHRDLLGNLMCLPGPGAMFRLIEDDDKRILRDPQYKLVSDLEFWMRLSLHGPMLRAPYELAEWREHSASQSAGGQGWNYANEIVKLSEDFFRYQPLPDSLKIEWKRAKAAAQFIAATHKVYAKEISGRRLILRSYWISLTSVPLIVVKSRSPLVALSIFLLPFRPRLLFRNFITRWRKRDIDSLTS